MIVGVLEVKKGHHNVRDFFKVIPATAVPFKQK